MGMVNEEQFRLRDQFPCSLAYFDMLGLATGSQEGHPASKNTASIYTCREKLDKILRLTPLKWRNKQPEGDRERLLFLTSSCQVMASVSLPVISRGICWLVPHPLCTPNCLHVCPSNMVLHWVLLYWMLLSVILYFNADNPESEIHLCFRRLAFMWQQ